MRIEGASAIVMGGASGLGEATARALVERGARVTIGDLNEEKGNALGEEIGATFLKADVTNATEVEAAVAAAAGGEGGLRIAVNCAGVGWAERISHKRGPHNLEMFEKVLQINLVGTFNALRFASAAMAQNDPAENGERGVCVNTA